MKQKIFFIVSSLSAGGSERVFWLLAQGFDKSKFDVSIVILNSENAFFSLNLEDVNIIDLKTIKTSLSFLKLYKLIQKERPYAIYSTAGHINTLISFISFFIHIPKMVARESNIPHLIMQYGNLKSKFWAPITKIFYKRFQTIVCQSDEMMSSVLNYYNIRRDKLVVIPNPVMVSDKRQIVNTSNHNKKIIMVARLGIVKSHERLLDIFNKLPENYTLTLAGEGHLRNQISEKVNRLNLDSRVVFLGDVTNVVDIIPEYDVLVLCSRTEGFPNVILEALSVGVPVVTFRVGGIIGLVEDGFNGFVLEQDDLAGFAKRIIETCNRSWDHDLIRNHVYERHALDKVVLQYESLIA